MILESEVAKTLQLLRLLRRPNIQSYTGLEDDTFKGGRPIKPNEHQTLALNLVVLALRHIGASDIEAMAIARDSKADRLGVARLVCLGQLTILHHIVRDKAPVLK